MKRALNALLRESRYRFGRAFDFLPRHVSSNKLLETGKALCGTAIRGLSHLWESLSSRLKEYQEEAAGDDFREDEFITLTGRHAWNEDKAHYV